MALALVSILAAAERPASHRALACTGGGAPLEWAATHADVIVVAEAIEVGDRANHAPTVTPLPRPSGTPTVGPPPAVRVTAGAFDFSGIGATMRVVRVLGGEAPEILQLDGASRAALERQRRELEAGTAILLCGFGAFNIRYAAGTRYLLFISNRDRIGASASLAFPVDGSDLITGDQLLVRANNGTLYLKTATYHQLFEGLPTLTVAGENTYLAPGRVPLVSVLRVVAAARGGQSITPPETGSAGLAAPRH